jgi:hypothetical protein
MEVKPFEFFCFRDIPLDAVMVRWEFQAEFCLFEAAAAMISGEFLSHMAYASRPNQGYH